MKKRLFSLLLVLVMSFAVFLPVSVRAATATATYNGDGTVTVSATGLTASTAFAFTIALPGQALPFLHIGFSDASGDMSFTFNVPGGPLPVGNWAWTLGYVVPGTVLFSGTFTVAPPTVTLTPATVTINDGTLSATSAVGGTATGAITLNTSALPAGVTAAESGGVITVTGVRPAAGQAAINGTFNVTVTREGVSEILAVAVNLTPLPAPTVTLTPAAVTINDGALTATSTVGGTATGPITLNTSALPAGVTAAESGGVITVTGVRPAAGQAAISGTFNVTVTRQGVSEILAVAVNLTPLPAPTAVTVSPASVTINNNILTATSTVGGTATGAIALNTSALPARVTATVNQTTGVITVAGARPAAGQAAISGTFNVTVTRGGQTATLAVNVNLTPPPTAPTVTVIPHTVTINNNALTATSTVGGTATGTISLNQGALPAGVTATVNQATGVITVTGVRPAAGQAAISGTFPVTVIRGGVSSTTLTVNVNLTPQVVAGEPDTNNGNNGTGAPTGTPATGTPAGTPPAASPAPIASPAPPAPPMQAPPAPPMQAPLAPVFAQQLFDDVMQGAWYYNYVNIVVTEGLFQGTAYRIFGPQTNMSRAMFAQVLANLEGVDLAAYAATNPTFQDVASNAWYFAAVQWAADVGVVHGLDGENFAPNDNVTREQMAAMLYRYANMRGITLATGYATPFVDQASISPWAVDAVAAIQDAGIVRGRGIGMFDPQATATRAEVAAIFARFLQMM